MNSERLENAAPLQPIMETMVDMEATDAERAARFWSREQPVALADAMKRNIESSMRYHQIGILIDSNGVTEEKEEMMSAFRVLAKENGYEIGMFRINPNNEYSLLAPLRKIK